MMLVNVGDVILFAEETYFSSALLQMEFQSSGEEWCCVENWNKSQDWAYSYPYLTAEHGDGFKALNWS